MVCKRSPESSSTSGLRAWWCGQRHSEQDIGNLLGEAGARKIYFCGGLFCGGFFFVVGWKGGGGGGERGGKGGRVSWVWVGFVVFFKGF